MSNKPVTTGDVLEFVLCLIFVAVAYFLIVVY